jgi:hypothetical protein
MKRAILLVVLLCAPSVWSDQQASKSGVIFNHEKHYDSLGVDCVQCHAAESSEHTSDVLLPKEAYCLSCHDGKVARKDCAVCHTTPDAPVSYPAEPRTLTFSHKTHLGAEEVTCLTCHDGIQTTTQAKGGLPDMDACFACHDGVRQTTDCVACHTDAEEVTLEIHPAGWQNDHRVFGNTNAPACEPCHRTDDRCSLCHQGDNLRANIHPLNWDHLHPIEARGRSTDCTACHDTQQFCVTCHRARLLLPLDHNLPDWLDRHGDEAQFDLETCDACHGDAEPTCYRAGCHAQ